MNPLWIDDTTTTANAFDFYQWELTIGIVRKLMFSAEVKGGVGWSKWMYKARVIFCGIHTHNLSTKKGYDKLYNVFYGTIYDIVCDIVCATPQAG